MLQLLIKSFFRWGRPKGFSLKIEVTIRIFLKRSKNSRQGVTKSIFCKEIAGNGRLLWTSKQPEFVRVQSWWNAKVYCLQEKACGVEKLDNLYHRIGTAKTINLVGWKMLWPRKAIKSTRKQKRASGMRRYIPKKRTRVEQKSWTNLIIHTLFQK